MKSSRFIWFVICSALLVFFFSACTGGPSSISFFKLELNNDVQENFAPGRTLPKSTFQYGQAADNALDILVPIDPSGTTDINKAYNYYLSSGSQVKFNMETIIEFQLYKIDKDLEDPGELNYPLQWMSMCTYHHPITGNLTKNLDGDPQSLVNDQNTNDFFTVHLNRCKTNPSDFTYLTPGGPFLGSCDQFELGGTNDPFAGQGFENDRSFPLCLLGARFTIDQPSSFSREVQVFSYNNQDIGFENKTFMDSIGPTFFPVSRSGYKYFVRMTPDPDNADVANGTGGDAYLRYQWIMPKDEMGIWQANFASDIDIEYVRFYWTDRGNQFPISKQPRLGTPSPEVQIGTGNVCRDSDVEGIFKTSNCNIFVNRTPAASQQDLTSRNVWNLAVFYDDHYYELAAFWGQPVIMEFGIRASD